MIFLTQHKEDFTLDTPNIVANSWKDAEIVVIHINTLFNTNIEVIGELKKVIYV